MATDAAAEVPVTLAQTYPNSFNPETRTAYVVPARATVRLDIYDLLGHKVRTLVDEEQAANTYAFVWNGQTAPRRVTGVYLYRLSAGGVEKTRTMPLLRWKLAAPVSFLTQTFSKR